MHACEDGRGRPLDFHLTGPEASEYGAIDDLMALPPAKSCMLLADKGYDGDAVSEGLLIHGILPTIPTPSAKVSVLLKLDLAGRLTESVC